jgi:hypothetical protein
MLHAEIHGKVSATSRDLERSEDILTSSVFGTLLLIPHGNRILADWFRRARLIGCDGSSSQERLLILDSAGPVEGWFWPRLAQAIPDVVLRIGSGLFVIEAKYGSSKGTALEDPDVPQGAPAPDQLLRQWRSVALPLPDAFDSPIREHIEACTPHLIYLVSARHTTNAEREIVESRRLVRPRELQPEAWLLTWQDLHLVLSEGHDRKELPAGDRELVALLARRELNAFRGFQELRVPHDSSMLTIGCWLGAWLDDGRATKYFDAISFAHRQETARISQHWAYST